MRISDWSADVCSSDLHLGADRRIEIGDQQRRDLRMFLFDDARDVARLEPVEQVDLAGILRRDDARKHILRLFGAERPGHHRFDLRARVETDRGPLARSEEHTSELQSLMRISYAVFCLQTNNDYS